MSPTAGRAPNLRRGRSRTIAAAMGLEALSLAVMSALHLSGTLDGAVSGGGRYAAGVAEALICAALAVGATTLKRGSPGARALATGTVVFAIVGFLIGLAITSRGGATVDLAYHATLLPILLVTLLALRARSSG